MQVNLMHFIAV